MTSLSPSNANDFIESLLDFHLEPIGKCLQGDILSFSGALIHGIDDIFRNALERLRQNSDSNKIVIVLETPGGYIEVVQRIVETLRFHYEYVDFLVPNYAFSAGTVFAMSGDAIYMNYYSRLGPIDPQVMGANENTVPALGYLVAWERLLEKARNGELTDIEAQLMLPALTKRNFTNTSRQGNCQSHYLRNGLSSINSRTGILPKVTKFQ